MAACFLLVLVVALTMRDKKPRFRFDAAPSPTPAAAAAPPASTALTTPSAAPDLQALFDQGRAESPLIAPVEAPPLFVPNTDYAAPPVYREIREVDLGKLYVSTPQKNQRALAKVARVGGFGSPEAMSRAFGYASVDAMLANWEQTLATTPQFRQNNFGTNAPPALRDQQ
jgi:hypothetical protein